MRSSLEWQYIYIPGTQMSLAWIEKDLVLEGSSNKIEDKQVPGICIYIYMICIFIIVISYLSWY